jgi:nucleoside-diphosphate-sugar epimerase
VRESTGKILVTGAGGRLGSKLVPKLISSGYEVIALTSNRLISASSLVKVIQVNWTDFHPPTLPKVDCVIHLAQQTSAYVARRNVPSDIESNLIATTRLIESLKLHGPVPKVIFFGSLTQYGSGVSNPISEITRLRPETFYDAAKIAVETYLEQYLNEGHIEELVVLRIGNLYGLGSNLSKPNRGFFDNAISLGAQGKSLVCFGDGKFIRDFVFVEDLLGAILKILDSTDKRDKLILNIASGVGTTIESALNIINFALVNRGLPSVKIDFLPFPPDLYGIEKRSHIADVSLAESTIGWRPAIDLFDGVNKCLSQELSRLDCRE